MRLFLFFLLLAAPLTQPASLSVSEQKKYKRMLEGEGLYTADDDVEVLTVDNFKREILGQPHAWVVEFYNSWCGFCQRFAPSWKALATDVKGWSDLIKVGAIDCSVDENSPICREYEIMGYPTLRYFHEGYVAGPQNLGVAVQKGDDVVSHRHFLLDRLKQEQTEGRGKQFPQLVALHQFNVTKEFLFVAVEATGYLGPEVAMDLHKTNQISVGFVYSNNSDFITKFGVSQVPSVVVMDKNNNFNVLPTSGSREEVKSLIKRYLENKNVKITDETPTEKIFTGKWLDVEVPDMAALIKQRAEQALKEKIKQMGDVVFQMDLETALRYALKHEISTNRLITGEKLKTLRDFLDILRKYFPFGNGGKVFLAELAMKAMEDPVQGSDLSEIIKRAEESTYVFSTPQQWLACRGSSPSYRGYPCGLWKLFHYLTVNAANSAQSSPLEVLSVMHSYIKNYFGCFDCSQHFQQMAVRREMHNVSSADSAVLWLWMAHNEVNKRLSGDQTEDPDFPKVQFPTKDHCSRCRDSDGTWNLVEVLKYLKQMYSALNVRYIGANTSVLHMGLEEVNVTATSTAATLDLSMCLVLYVAAFFFLGILIRLFLKKGYRKKIYVHDLRGKV